MRQITYVKGDATAPIGAGDKIIAHVCNDVGGWGKGFVLAISKKWSKPEAEYRAWIGSGQSWLGSVQLLLVEPKILVCNMLAQRGLRSTKESPAIDYPALDLCLGHLGYYAEEHNCSVHMPRIGCGLAGGKWEEVEPLIIKNCTSRGVATYVYDL